LLQQQDIDPTKILHYYNVTLEREKHAKSREKNDDPNEIYPDSYKAFDRITQLLPQ
jgi:hypothetical protein